MYLYSLWSRPLARAVISSCLLAAVSSAQQVRQQAIGFVLDSATARVRPIWGVPGASVVGGPIDLGGAVSAIAASPKQDYVVFLSGPASTAQIWMHDTQTISVIANVRTGAAQVILSPEGASAAFYYPDTNRVHVVTGLPSAPVAAIDADLSALMNPLKSLAVSDDGALVLASESFVDGNAAPAVAVFSAQGLPVRIPLTGPVSAMAFLSNSHGVLLSSASESVLIRDAVAQTGRITLPSAANSAVGVLSSSDSSRAFFANAQAGTVSILSLNSAGAQPAIVNCNCVPTGISRTATPSIYRLTEDSGAPVPLLDVSSNQPRLLVVPPAVNSVPTPDNQ
jgi:hypothetical protein